MYHLFEQTISVRGIFVSFYVCSAHGHSNGKTKVERDLKSCCFVKCTSISVWQTEVVKNY